MSGLAFSTESLKLMYAPKSKVADHYFLHKSWYELWYRYLLPIPIPKTTVLAQEVGTGTIYFSEGCPMPDVTPGSG